MLSVGVFFFFFFRNIHLAVVRHLNIENFIHYRSMRRSRSRSHSSAVPDPPPTPDPRPDSEPTLTSSVSEEFRTTASEEEPERETDSSDTVTQIFTHRKTDDGKTEYFVKLHGRPYRDARWVSESLVQSTCSAKLSVYKKTYGDTPASPPYYDPSYEMPEKVIAQENSRYLVKWTNLDYDQCTWDPPEVIDCPELIQQFLELNTLPSLDHLVPPPHPDPSAFRPITRHKESKSGLTMRSYQTAGVNFLVNSWYNHRNAILADEMGLGKTAQALGFLEYLYEKESVHGNRKLRNGRICED
jgi:SNF2 family DNA or RNA helicase